MQERTGDNQTGLKEETITKLLKRRKYKYVRHEREREILSDAQECLICKVKYPTLPCLTAWQYLYFTELKTLRWQEYYVDGEEIGKLQCGHEFHAECIKKVLLSINECTICSDKGLNA